MAVTEVKTLEISSFEVPGIAVKIENISDDISLLNLIAKGEAIKNSLKQKRHLKEEIFDNFIEQLKLKLKNKLDTSIKELALEPALPTVAPTPLPRSVTNGSKPNLRRSRSCSSIVEQQNKKPKGPIVSNTPLPTITPKVQPHASSIVFRRPKKGEVIVSMQGSPVIGNNANSAITTINIPMNNGNLMSMLPELELQPHLPNDIDEETKGQLQTLCGHLKQFIDKL